MQDESVAMLLNACLMFQAHVRLFDETVLSRRN